jgi:hypothetical protein
MAIKMKEVKSQSISKIGYFRRTMNVVFQNGKTYEFKKVPRVEFDKFTSSDSKGKFFLNEVKGIYPFKELAM